MSLRDLGVYAPLPADHPLALVDPPVGCWICGRPLRTGVRTALMPYQTPEETGEDCVEARPVCATCYLRGEIIVTPCGQRIVATVKDGHESPFPVETTDGGQWRDEDVAEVET